MSNCTSGCRTQDHESYTACLKAKSVRTNALNPVALSTQRAADKTLDKYAHARRNGIQPASTRPADIERAVRISDQTGKPYQA